MTKQLNTQDKMEQALAAYSDLDYKQALPLLEELAALEIPDACVHLAYIYADGNEDVAKDEALSTIWYSKYFFLLRRQVQAGDAEASYKLASSYQYGSGIRCDEKKAVEFYTLSASNGHAEAQFHLSCLWKYGWCGLRANPEQRMYWLDQAVRLEHPEALYTFGLMYMQDTDDFDKEQGLHFIRRSAELGYWVAIDYLKWISVSRINQT